MQWSFPKSSGPFLTSSPSSTRARERIFSDWKRSSRKKKSRERSRISCARSGRSRWKSRPWVGDLKQSYRSTHPTCWTKRKTKTSCFDILFLCQRDFSFQFPPTKTLVYMDLCLSIRLFCRAINDVATHTLDTQPRASSVFLSEKRHFQVFCISTLKQLPQELLENRGYCISPRVGFATYSQQQYESEPSQVGKLYCRGSSVRLSHWLVQGDAALWLQQMAPNVSVAGIPRWRSSWACERGK